MPLDIVVGCQWGDEGKGHITDLLAATADIVARYSGGDNAGHTVAIEEKIFKLHLIPSGIIHKDTVGVIGNGVVVNPVVLLQEITELRQRGIVVNPERLLLSDRAHMITPAHLRLDMADEKSLGKEAIGTTGRGIGPAYTDKTSRQGLRVQLLTNPARLEEELEKHILQKNTTLSEMYESGPLEDTNDIIANFMNYSRQLSPFVRDTGAFLFNQLSSGRQVLAEGAQGTLLDLDHGTYPYVTSSWPTAAGALGGLGLGPKNVRDVIGVAKAFTSRVGSGPFPTELAGEEAIRLRGTGENPWDEFGTTTGRPRRVGWLDTVILKYSARINGLTQLAITKLDILSYLAEIPICIGYRVGDREVGHFPADLETLEKCKPVYTLVKGWQDEITHARHFSDLPQPAQEYVNFVAKSVGVPVRYISVGPRRDQIICF